MQGVSHNRCPACVRFTAAAPPVALRSMMHVRTPTAQPLPHAHRLCLGGVAGEALLLPACAAVEGSQWALHMSCSNACLDIKHSQVECSAAHWTSR